MCLLFETIRVANRQFCHPHWHQERMNRSRAALFSSTNSLSLASVSIPETLPSGGLKCNIVYDNDIRHVTFKPYIPRQIRTVRLVHADQLLYPFKYLDRSTIEEQITRYPEADELIFIRNGLICDSTFSNLAFFDGTLWYTPAVPLLPGTCRERLLHQGVIRKASITPVDLKRFSCVSFINAMLDLGQTVLSIDPAWSSIP